MVVDVGGFELVRVLLVGGAVDVLSFFDVFFGFFGGGRFRKFRPNKDASHIRLSTEDSILLVMSGTFVMYSGIRR